MKNKVCVHVVVVVESPNTRSCLVTHALLVARAEVGHRQAERPDQQGGGEHGAAEETI